MVTWHAWSPCIFTQISTVGCVPNLLTGDLYVYYTVRLSKLNKKILTMTEFVKCWAAFSKDQPLGPHEILRRAVGPNDVKMLVKFAGICHSDIHQARNEWGGAIFPMVPGHENVGLVTEVGSNVTAFKIGDVAGVGCMVDSCRTCSNCSVGEEQYCSPSGPIFTYNSTSKYAHCIEYNAEGGAPTYGGYSQSMVVDSKYVLRVPENLDMAGAAPLLCAGITTYSPFKSYGLKPHMKLGVIGLGGLGHMGVKFGKAWGCNTTVISRGTSKMKDALEHLGADAFLDATDEGAMKLQHGTFDFLYCTISGQFNITTYLNLLALDGTIVLVGAPPENLSFSAFSVIGGRKRIVGSLIGGIAQTQEMLDFCGQHNIVSDVEVIPADKINEAYDRTVKSDVKYRFCIDCSTF